MNIKIQFEGWYQCRLATDPDAYDDPRGSQGWTFAFAGEPDLDRIIRFHDPVSLRSHSPKVGVYVKEVSLDDQIAGQHALVGAKVSLNGNPVYDGRNGEIATSAQEPIVPWKLAINGGGIAIETFDPIDLTDRREIERRQPVNFTSNSSEVATATGISNFAAYRQSKATVLQAELAGETDPVRQQALQSRLVELRRGSIRLTSLGFQLDYEFRLRGPNSISDPQHKLGQADLPSQWTAKFWMGGWDADGLCAFVKGALVLT